MIITSGIYAIIGPNGKAYCGQTTSFVRRSKQHFIDLAFNRHPCKHLQNAYNKHGRAAFRFQILEQIKDPLMFTTREQFWINQYHLKYNHAPARDAKRRNG